MLSHPCWGQHCSMTADGQRNSSLKITFSIPTIKHLGTSIQHSPSPPLSPPPSPSSLSLSASPSHSVNHLCGVSARLQNSCRLGMLPCEGNCMSGRQSRCKTPVYQIQLRVGGEQKLIVISTGRLWSRCSTEWLFPCVQCSLPTLASNPGMQTWFMAFIWSVCQTNATQQASTLWRLRWVHTQWFGYS